MSGGHQGVNLTLIFKEHAIVFTLSLHYSSFLSLKTFVISHGSHIMTMLMFPKSTVQLRHCFELRGHRFCLFTAYTHTFLYMYFKFYKDPEILTFKLLNKPFPHLSSPSLSYQRCGMVTYEWSKTIQFLSKMFQFF